MNGLIKNSADALDFTRWVLAGCPGADIKSEHAKRANEALGEFLLANYDPDNRLKDMGDLAEKSDVFMNEMYYFVRHWHDVKIGTN